MTKENVQGAVVHGNRVFPHTSHLVAEGLDQIHVVFYQLTFHENIEDPGAYCGSSNKAVSHIQPDEIVPVGQIKGPLHFRISGWVPTFFNK